MSLLGPQTCWITNGRVVVDKEAVSARYPLVGLFGAFAWSFDGQRLRLVFIRVRSCMRGRFAERQFRVAA